MDETETPRSKYAWMIAVVNQVGAITKNKYPTTAAPKKFGARTMVDRKQKMFRAR